MKPRIEFFVIFVLLVFSIFHFSKAALLSFPASCNKIWEHSTQVSSISECKQIFQDPEQQILNHLQMLHMNYEMQFPELVLIIADQMENGVNLARFLSKNNKRPTTNNRTNYKNEELLTYDFILNNIQFYQIPDKPTVFFVYPHQTSNDQLASLLATEVIRNTKSLRILLTTSIPSDQSDDNDLELLVHQVFDTAGKFIRNSKGYHCSLVVTSVNSKATKNSKNDIPEERKLQNYRDIIKKYSKHPDATESGKLFATQNTRNLIFLDRFSNSYYKKMVPIIENLERSSVNVKDFINSLDIFSDCISNHGNDNLGSVFDSLESEISKKLSPSLFNESTLTGVLGLSGKLNLMYTKLTSFFVCLKTEDAETVSGCFETLITGLQGAGIDNLDDTKMIVRNHLSLLCNLHEWFDAFLARRKLSDTPPTKGYVSIKIERRVFRLRKYSERLKLKMAWYKQLVKVFQNPQETDVSGELKILEDKLSEFPEVDTMRIAHATIKSNLYKMAANVSCVRVADEMKLQITGKFLRLSQILDGSWCSEKHRILEIFALEKFIIDRDLVADIDVYVFAPVWEVVLNRSIVLDGVNKDQGEVPLNWKAKNGNQMTNRNGANGQAGLPGGTGGTFYGLARTIISADSLRISVKGGNGSDGQDGGDGADGPEGEAPSKHFLNAKFNRHRCAWPRYEKYNFRIERPDRDYYYHNLIGPRVQLTYKKECYIFGLEGYPGGHGGHGGIKGKGGSSGDYKLFLLDDSPVSVISETANGTDGAGGLGGKAGKGGLTRKSTLHNEDYFNHYITENVTDIRATDGNKGENDFSNIGLKVVKDQPPFQTFAETANLYKRFILQNLDYQPKYLDLYKQVINKRQITKTYDTLSLVEELIDLEQHYYNTPNKPQTLFLYQEWKTRLEFYASNRKKNEETNEYSEILRRLEGVVSLKIKSLDKNSHNNLIFMLAEYLLEIQKHVNHLHDAKTVVIIKNTNKKYTEEYGDKIDEAQRIIQEDLQSNLTMAGNELSGELEMLLRKISRLTASSERSAEELASKSSRMQDQAVIKTFNDIFSLLNAGLGIINPALATIGNKISSAGSILLNFVDETEDTNILEVRIPNMVQKSREFFNNWVDMKKEFQKLAVDENLKLLKDEEERLSKNGQNVDPIRGVEKTFTKLQNLMEQEPNRDVLLTMNDEIEIEESMWKKIYTKKKDLYKAALNALKKIKTFTKFKQILGELSTKCEDLRDPRRIDEISDQVQAAFDKTRKLRKLKEEILIKMVPLLQKIRRDTNVQHSSSVAYLDFKKFEMKEYFERVLSQIEYYAKEFQLSSYFEKTLQKMKAVIDMILSTYVRIEEYVDTMKKADYEKDLYLAPFDVTYVKDAKLSMALAKMVQTSFGNIVLDDYSKWLASFKQYIFPFADEFLDVFESLIPEVDDLLIRAQDAGEKLEFYGSKMNKRRAELREFENTVTTKFGYSLPPFHVWNSSHFGKEISAILSGEKVTLLADIKEHRNLNAVKFSDIWLRFSSNDSKIQEKIKQDLKGYAVILTHTGNSFYRCDERVFAIYSESRQMERVYNDDKVEHFDESVAVKTTSQKINSDYILSPYATWTIELVSEDVNRSFETFKEYKSHLNMELVGSGQYTDKNVPVCRTNLNKYYTNEL